jgi:hypothetical protein
VQRRTRVNIREDERISAQRYGTNSEGQVKYAVARFLDMPRRIAQERVPRSMSGRAM